MTTLSDPRTRNDFLDMLHKCGDITHACKVTRVSRRSYYDWYKKDPGFKELADLARDAFQTEQRIMYSAKIKELASQRLIERLERDEVEASTLARILYYTGCTPKQNS